MLEVAKGGINQMVEFFITKEMSYLWKKEILKEVVFPLWT